MERKVQTTTNDDLTLGQKLVGLNFNVGQNPQVHKSKLKCAELIDQLAEIEAESKLQSSIIDEAISQVLTAQMWVVKAITWKD
jgi:hypothetical protein